MGGPKCSPRAPRELPRAALECPGSALRHPKCALGCSRGASRGSQGAPRLPKTAPKSLLGAKWAIWREAASRCMRKMQVKSVSIMGDSFSAQLRKTTPNRPQMAPRIVPNRLSETSRGPLEATLGEQSRSRRPVERSVERLGATSSLQGPVRARRSAHPFGPPEDS